MMPTNRVARGLAWGTAHQLVEVALAFLAMLALVRIIPPEEYGRWSALLGILAVLNALGFAGFAAQALQVAEAEEPDWSLHYSVGLYIQGSLMLACHALGALCWFSAAYRPIAPLLHLAAFGLLLDWPAQLRAVMLRREMDFRRLKILMTCSTLLKLATTLVLGVAGAGAYALVLGANVVTALPLAVDLLAVRRWRPRRGWWHWPDWAAYGKARRFGLQQLGSGILGSLRGGLEAAVLPHALGYGPMGLLDRARGCSAARSDAPATSWPRRRIRFSRRARRTGPHSRAGPRPSSRSSASRSCRRRSSWASKDRACLGSFTGAAGPRRIR